MPTVKSVYTLLILITAVLICNVTRAQPTNFIHIQSENNQPFYVQLNGSVYSSSVTGYLVIPQVPVGEHTLIVGFPRNIFPEYVFTCSMADKPRGYSLKQSVDNSWSLFDMVSFTVTKGVIASKEQLQAAAPKPENAVPDKSITIETTPSPNLVTGKDKPVSMSRIQKIFDKSGSGGIDQVYIVFNGTKADTVALFIPVLPDEKSKQPGARVLPSSKNRVSKAGIGMMAFFRITPQSLLSKELYAPLFSGTGL